MDYIKVKGVKVFAHHGVIPQERASGQEFIVDVTMGTRTWKAAAADELEKTIDYGAVCEKIVAFMEGNQYKLIETCAERLADKLLRETDGLSEITVEIHKPNAPIEADFEDVSVCITRKKHVVYIGLGSNMGDKGEFLYGAIDALGAHPDIEVKKISTLIETKPYGNEKQDDFLNGAIKVETMLSPMDLLDVCQKLEDEAGRERTEHWGPRTLDLDILCFDDEIIETERLVVPHPDMMNRDFVLRPMTEIASKFVHPVTGKTMGRMMVELHEKEDKVPKRWRTNK
ncbi:MAG: 2-amino-4-hydroxy-6-hydroxymethyldihydropteridine diphosphokinase [Firmicutes bacterium]|nr:2-amino-4-hydroxy-6-hydroxymethyldihydropteridine diphosphokinase [Bacillota bacterium]